MNEKSRDKIQEIIEASGNNFHASVIKFLREKEWFVLISPYYNDYATDKAREIDILIRSLVVSHTMLITCLFKRLFEDCHVALLMTSLV